MVVHTADLTNSLSSVSSGDPRDARLLRESIRRTIQDFPREHGLNYGELADQIVRNICLIDAAPDLLEALIAMEAEKADYMRINNLGDPAREHTNKQARAAIAKALGLSDGPLKAKTGNSV